ncbi:MAG: pyridoxal 5'-phosphate synthase glutaminase subunit PdxT [Actinomycetota bacterium]|nr:pyridoxal 5'-phosphate synthase glutaminase subunit PdxT [Actinomycetota bacterium]
MSTATVPPDAPTARPVVGVLALQGDFAEHTAMLESIGVSVVEVRGPSDLERIEGIVVPGGESTTLSMLLDSSDVREPLARSLAGGMPALGTCAGMILLAREVLGGRPDQRSFGAIDLAVRRNAFGRQVDSFEADLDVVGLAGPSVHAVFIRAPVVERVGPTVEVLASVELGGELRPVVCREGAVIVAAFHPELAGDTRLHALFVETVLASRAELSRAG